MKVAVTSQGEGNTAPVDPRFGRARYFAVVDSESGESRTVDNTVNLNAAQGAGIQAGRSVVDLGVGVLITGHVGPKAFAVLQAGGVKVYTGASGTVADAIEQYRAGKLKAADSADVEGHWTSEQEHWR
jgi:predicted Fe-Mo cluster-binding NifX family protein